MGQAPISNLITQSTNKKNDEQQMNLIIQSYPIMITDLNLFVQDQDFPNIISIDWQVVNAKTMEVKSSESLIVKPTNISKIKAQTLLKTGVTELMLQEKGITLSEALAKFTEFLFKELIMQNQSFQLITFGDWPLQYQLPIEATQKSIKLGPHFSQYINYMKLVLELYGVEVAAKLTRPEQIVNEFNIGEKLIDIPIKSTFHCALMIEFFKNKMLPDLQTVINEETLGQDVCYSPTNVIEQKGSKEKDFASETAKTLGLEEETKHSSLDQNPLIMKERKLSQEQPQYQGRDEMRKRSRSRSYERNKRDSESLRQSEQQGSHHRNQTSNGDQNRNQQPAYVKISNIPIDTKESDIFNQIPKRITIFEIAIGRDQFDQHACIFRIDRDNLDNVLELGITHIKDQQVQVNEGTQGEFNHLRQNRRGGSNEHERADPQIDFSKYDLNDYLGLKLRGLPFSIKRDEINQFFSNFNYVRDSVKLGRTGEGLLTGEGAILFHSEEDSKKAFQQRQGQSIGHRWIELYQITIADYQNFEEMQKQRRTVKLGKYITDSNRERIMKLRGLPFQVQPDDITRFFKDYQVTKSDVVIEEINGKKTGFGLVFFKDQETAQQAQENMNRKKIGNRYVEIMEPTITDMMPN
eukprot:403372892